MIPSLEEIHYISAAANLDYSTTELTQKLNSFHWFELLALLNKVQAIYDDEIKNKDTATIDKNHPDIPISYQLAKQYGCPIAEAVCPTCGNLHIDLNQWAIKPHKKHLCSHCNEIFEADFRGVSLPVSTLFLGDNE